MHDTQITAGLQPALTEVIAIARAAGAAIMTVYRTGDIGTTSKADSSPLTLADIAAHQVIVNGLGRLKPRYPVLSEETAEIEYEERSKWPRYWLVDPLDGTKEFIKRNGEFTVNIALIENDMPILGVVYAPVLDVCYYADKDGGAYVRRGSTRPEAIHVRTAAKMKPSKSSRVVHTAMNARKYC